MNLSPPIAEELKAFERFLGHPGRPDNGFGFAAAVQRDHGDHFPEEEAERLRELGFHLSHWSRAWGGEFETYFSAMLKARLLARRDLSLMPASLLSISAAAAVALAGNAEQKAQVQQLLRDGHFIGFALSEEESGGDLLKSQTLLLPRPGGGGYWLRGRKWLVGAGQLRRLGAVYVVGKSGAAGPGAFTGVLVPVDDAFRAHTRISPRTVSGMRGIDFVDLTFSDLPVPAVACIGTPGHGLETALRVQQVVRMMSTAGSLGCADTGLRMAYAFATQRPVDRGRLAETAYAKSVLGRGFTALLLMDVAALAASRAASIVTRSYVVWSCVVKYLATELSADVFHRAALILGARSVLRGRTDIFEKMQRDNAIVRVIDTSRHANLRIIGMHLRAFAQAHTAAPTPQPELADQMARIFSLQGELPPFDFTLLEMICRESEPVLAGLRQSRPEICHQLSTTEDPAGGHVHQFLDELDRFMVSLAAPPAGNPAVNGAASLELVCAAERFCYFHAGACCTLLWWHNRERSLFGATAGSTRWLRVALEGVRARLKTPECEKLTPEVADAFELGLAQFRNAHLFSALELPLAEGEPAPGASPIETLQGAAA